jgi:hypothetical protein
MARFLDSPVGQLAVENDFLQLLEELTNACGVDHRSAATLHFLPFLNFCLHPMGGGSPCVPLHLRQTRPGYLETKIEKLGSSNILQLCEELAAVIREPLEMHVNKKLMTFFNLVVRQTKRQSKRRNRRQ